MESDQHFLTLVRYVERNAKRAALVKRAEDGPWSSAHARVHGNEPRKKLLSPWPMPEPRHYVQWLNESQGQEEIENIRSALQRGRPYGSEKWVAKTVAEFALQSTLRNPWRPKKGS